jgi:3D (Asp-Asp-Asp) domain-containing protein
MVRYKLYGIISLFIFSVPKLFQTAPQREAPITQQIAQMPDLVQALTRIEPKIEPVAAPKPKPIKVTASVYFPEVAQTDSTPFITADGSKINPKKPRKHRWVAVSRNLLRKYGGSINYGDTLRVKGISEKLDGHYVVRDTMKRQLRNRIDILVGADDDIMGKWKNVKIYTLN